MLPQRVVDVLPVDEEGDVGQECSLFSCRSRRSRHAPPIVALQDVTRARCRVAHAARRFKATRLSRDKRRRREQFLVRSMSERYGPFICTVAVAVAVCVGRPSSTRNSRISVYASAGTTLPFSSRPSQLTDVTWGR